MVEKHTMSGGGGVANISMGALLSAAGAAVLFALLELRNRPVLCTLGVVVLCFGLSLLSSASPDWSRRFLATALLLWGLGLVLLAVFPGFFRDTGVLKLALQPTGVGRLATLGVGAVLALLGRGILRGQVEVGRPG